MANDIRVTVIATGFDAKKKQQAIDFEEEAAPVPTFEPMPEDELDIPAFLKRRV